MSRARGEADDLFVAAQAVGERLGITINPPLAADDPARAKHGLELIARASRMRIRKLVLNEGWWRSDCGPLLGSLGSRPVALLPAGGSRPRYDLLDPRTGERTRVDATLARELAPDAFMFYRQLPAGFRKPWEMVRFAIHGRRNDLLMMLAMGVLATVLGMLTPHAMAVLTDTAIPGANRGLLGQLGAALFVAALGMLLFGLAHSIARTRVSTYADAHTQAAVWDRLLGLKLSFFRAFTVGDLLSRVSAVNRIRQVLTGTTLVSLFASLFALLNLGLLVYYSPTLAAVAVVVAGLSASLTLAAGVALYRLNGRLFEQEGRVQGLVIQLVGSVAKLRVAGAEERAFSHWAGQIQEEMQLRLRVRQVNDAVTVANVVVASGSTVALYWIAAGLLMQPGSGLSYGEFLAFNAAYGMFLGGVTGLSNTVTGVLDVLTLNERARPILAAEPEVNQAAADPGRLRGAVRVDRVSFRYRADGPLALDGVSIHAEPGELVALVGPSGSGKSTLLRLLLGFDEPESGRIQYDGRALSSLDVRAVRRQLGVVLQNGKLNAASIFDNIAGQSRISLPQAWKAAESAAFAADVRAMPMQMHTAVSEGGTNLSGGQRQRLLIARALVRQPRVLLLDEATSALDTTAQAVVTASLDHLQATRFVIAQRLGTVRNADRIYVLDAGRIVQAGTYDDLAREDGLFRRLLRRQT